MKTTNRQDRQLISLFIILAALTGALVLLFNLATK